MATRQLKKCRLNSVMNNEQQKPTLDLLAWTRQSNIKRCAGWTHRSVTLLVFVPFILLCFEWYDWNVAKEILQLQIDVKLLFLPQFPFSMQTSQIVAFPWQECKYLPSDCNLGINFVAINNLLFFAQFKAPKYLQRRKCMHFQWNCPSDSKSFRN